MEDHQGMSDLRLHDSGKGATGHNLNFHKDPPSHDCHWISEEKL